MSKQYIARHDKAMRTVIQAFPEGLVKLISMGGNKVIERIISLIKTVIYCLILNKNSGTATNMCHNPEAG